MMLWLHARNSALWFEFVQLLAPQNGDYPAHRSFFKIEKTSYTWPFDTDAAMGAAGALLQWFCLFVLNKQTKPNPYTQNSYADTAMEALLHCSLMVSFICF